MKYYDQAQKLTEAVLKNQISTLALIGENGLGKTKTIENIVNNQKLNKNIPGGVVFINGHKTLPALCRQLDELNRKTPNEKKTTIVLNDCSLLHSNNPRDVAFLKALLESDRSGTASYATNNSEVTININKLNFIFTANEYSTINSPHLRAIFDRIHTVVFKLSLTERFKLTKRLFIDEANTSPEEKEDDTKLLNDIIEKVTSSKNTNYSLRSFKKLKDIKNISNNLFKTQLDIDFPINEKLKVLIKIEEESDDKTQELTKISKFEHRTGLKRRSYFYHKKKFLEWKKFAETYPLPQKEESLQSSISLKGATMNQEIKPKKGIEWTNKTWNPMRGCTKVSPGCLNCYAETFANRFKGTPNNAYEKGFLPRIAPEMLNKPKEWSKPTLVFVNSMSDFFHKDFSTEYLKEVCEVMKSCSHHTFQILTKRAERLHLLLNNELREYAKLDNIWWGVSVEDRKFGIPRIDLLRDTPATIKFLSCEPLLEDLGTLNLENINWVIVGGESGSNYRAMKEDWALSILNQCTKENIPFFFKQWAGKSPKKLGRLLNGKEYNEYPNKSLYNIENNKKTIKKGSI